MPRELAPSRTRRSSFRKAVSPSLPLAEEVESSPRDGGLGVVPAAGVADAGPAPNGGRRLEMRREADPAIAIQEKVIGEISHELGNFFHKLYYWSDYLHERRAGDATATQMMQRTIRNLEEFLKVALDCFRPLKLSTLRMPAADLVAGVVSQMRAQAGEGCVEVADAGRWEGRSVLVDPGRLPPVFLVALRRLAEQAAPGSVIRVTLASVRSNGQPGLEVVFALEDASAGASLFQTAAAGIEWAVAERIVALHGGELCEAESLPGARILRLDLPFTA